VRVRFHLATRIDVPDEDRDLSVIPRVGDEVIFGEEDAGTDRGFTVRTVRWYLDEPDFDVHVVLG
jgi:hypothetical protein